MSDRLKCQFCNYTADRYFRGKNKTLYSGVESLTKHTHRCHAEEVHIALGEFDHQTYHPVLGIETDPVSIDDLVDSYEVERDE